MDRPNNNNFNPAQHSNTELKCCTECSRCVVIELKRLKYSKVVYRSKFEKLDGVQPFLCKHYSCPS